MEIIFIIIIGLLVVGASICLTLIRKKNLRIKKLEDSLKEDLIKLSHRIGFYDGNYTLGPGANNKYHFRVYVTELEKYGNGFSKF